MTDFGLGVVAGFLMGAATTAIITGTAVGLVVLYRTLYKREHAEKGKK